MYIVYRVFIFAVVIIAFTYSTIEECVDNRTLWLDHKLSFNNFSCSAPKPLSILTTELFNESTAKKSDLDPWFTVLHRCGNHSGCCQVSTKACMSIKGTEQYINLTFLNITKGLADEEYVSILAENHTECSCQYVP